MLEGGNAAGLVKETCPLLPSETKTNSTVNMICEQNKYLMILQGNNCYEHSQSITQF